MWRNLHRTARWPNVRVTMLLLFFRSLILTAPSRTPRLIIDYSPVSRYLHTFDATSPQNPSHTRCVYSRPVFLLHTHRVVCPEPTHISPRTRRRPSSTHPSSSGLPTYNALSRPRLHSTAPPLLLIPRTRRVDAHVCHFHRTTST